MRDSKYWKTDTKIKDLRDDSILSVISVLNKNLKSKFKDKCKREGLDMSEQITDLIIDWLAGEQKDLSK